MDGSMDAFLLSLNPSGSALVFSTYFGGLSEDKAKGIGLDSAGNVYFAGYTYSTDFPTVKPVQLMNGGGYDAFVAAVRPDGSAVLFSSYLGGSSTEYLSLSGSGGIALDDSGVYLTGETDSADFPTQFAFQKTRGSAPDAFVVKLSPALDFFIAAAEVPTPRKRGDIE
jgi:Tol biopolymer transport system component